MNQNLFFATLRHCAQVGDRIFLSVAAAIVRAGRPLAVCELTAALGVKRQTLERQVRRLKQDGSLQQGKLEYRIGHLVPVYSLTANGAELYNKAIKHIIKLKKRYDTQAVPIRGSQRKG